MHAAALNRNGLGLVLGVAIAYFLFAAAAIAFTRLSHNVALLWIANAPLLAALLTRPPVERPWHVIACFAASIAATVSVSPYSALSPLFAFANIGEALLAYLLLRRFGGAERPFDDLRSLAIFIAAAGIAAPLVTGLLPGVALWAFQGTSPLVSGSNWLVGHGLGTLIGTPVALLAIGGAAYRERFARPHQPLRVLWVAALLLGITGLCFAQDGLPLLFLPLLPLVIATMIFRLAGAALGVFAVAMIGAVFTVSGHGPIQLIADGEAFHLQFFQFYLAVLFLTAMPFATMIAEKNRLAAAVAESEARYRLIAEHASDAVMVLDRRGDVLFASPAVREIGGYDPAKMIGQSSFAFISEPDRERMRAAHAHTLGEPDRVHRIEFRAVTAAGVPRWFESTARAVTDAQGEVTTVVTIVRDLSHRKAREADLERQATTDSMTGVLNRRAFQKRLAEVAREESVTGVLALLDLDHFKQVNDRFGHAAGDAALLTFADVMRGKLRQEDAIGRLGGEEFAVLFPGLTADAALAACERVRQTLEDTEIVTPQGSFRITVSIGLAALCPGMAPEAVFRQSDAALYRAKALGRNRSELAAV
ncbi:diguanylate cyclase [Sphingomonas sp. MG17]|jgi:diguanylate cyclase (GGDEF)-like protein/PAS domain S-box-containing protein|uniref:Diguanylate cyclase n=1 Tax=Sphingomonas tagetis TaxID=2949092 RepID=A0A9X2HEQ8_9SPHN|nr:diguanylate cyclase [Sphingomonas tagetis]MCP3729766.1 diguanylate cyclase [Sphingomonas tagetis]